MNKASRKPTNGPQGAVQGSPRPTVGEPKVAARKGVLSAVGVDPQTVTVTGITPGLQISCEGIAVADWLCACGHHERARGRAAVIHLSERVRAGVCPHTTAEGRVAS
ncbi:hypothetical protein PV387_05480 [Streptomyces sp. ME02-6987-2C]|uniref:hypothetical protein n=1 Tax=unclassified Streptomyces TaxID=2593676 RepID=UPI0029AA596E|nr:MULTISPECIES: hypothetical protein [unclassified Streptomyces]MDX3365482.1 hypothetical protein [Streptomyces sp. ME02-6987-2C]MDX3422612.1 hypothetical protein [Streptomyces sp. ME02-6985-2c]